VQLAGPLPWALLGELTIFPRSCSWITGATLWGGKEWKEWREKKGRERERNFAVMGN